MADIDRRNGKWVARWRDPDGRQRWKTFTRKLDAERFMIALQADLQRGTYTDPRAGAVPLAEYAEKWLAAQLHLRPNSAELYAQHVRGHIIPKLGRYRLGAIRHTEVQNFVTAVAAEVAPSTTETVYAVLRALMQGAVDDGLIPANPCTRKVKRPKVEKRVLVPLPAGAVHALAAAMTPRYELAVWLAAGAGLREGEALGLTAARVDFLRGREIHVLEQMQNRRLSPLKTRASQRTVPADDFLLAKITAHMQRHPPGADGVLITNRLGGHVQRNSFGHCWRAAVAEAGLPAGTRFHDLRHYYASTLIAAGLHPKVIQARLGHATLAETMDTYGHLFPDAADLGRGAIDAALGGSAHILHTQGPVTTSTTQLYAV